MLSISNVSGGQVASGYYQSEGYYLEGSAEAEKSAEFYGKAATEAGLTEEFSAERFVALLDGQTPDGRLLGRWRDGEREHRPGIDLTFSPAKSVSIAALVVGDDRIIKAHTDSVKVALDYAEQHFVATRRTLNGELVREHGGKIIAALFQHDTSRALDPQLHTHAVIANMVKDSTGGFRSLSNEELYNGKMLLGQIYRGALAEKLQDLGYDLQKGRGNEFEIKGIPTELLERFSKRRQEILQSLADRNTEPTAKMSALAALATRAAKKPVDRAELHAAWQAEVKDLGIDLAQSLAEATRHKAPTQDQRDATAKEAVGFAIDHHAERNAVYTRAELLHTAMAFRPAITVASATRELNARSNAGEIHAFTIDGEVSYTDTNNIALEMENRHLVRSDVLHQVVDLRSPTDRLTRRSSDAIVSRKLEKTTLNAGQKDAAAMILSSHSYVVGVQGYAGTGKTYMLATAERVAKTVQRFAAARGYAIEGIAPSHKAVSALNESLASAATVESMLIRHEHGANLGDKSRTILAVDEASMLSSSQMNRILKMAKGQGYAKVALIGDVKQLDAVGAGSAFRALQEAGMPTATVSENQRQRTPQGRDAVAAAIEGDIGRAMSKVNHITEVGGKKLDDIRASIASEMADAYATLPAEKRASTGLIVLTNALRIDVNNQVQHNLKASGALGDREADIEVLVPRNFTQAQARDVGSYQRGDIVVAPVAPSGFALTSNTLYTVTATDLDKRLLSLSAPDGSSVSLPLDVADKSTPNLAVYGSDQQRFVVGDRVKFKITDREHGIQNAAEGTLRNLGRSSIHVETDVGERLNIPTSSLAAKGMQLAYAATAHDFQGSTVDEVMLAMISKEQLTTQKSFYVGLSRMRDSIHLYTDKTSDLTEQIREQTGERVNALDALAQDREQTKADDAKRPQDRPELDRKDTSEDSQKPAPDQRQKDTDPDAKTRSDIDPEKPDQQSFIDKLIVELNPDQKQRGQRIR